MLEKTTYMHTKMHANTFTKFSYPTIQETLWTMVKSFAFIFEGITFNNGEKQNTNDKGKKLVQILNHFFKTLCN
jgi:hypothetical protein